MTVVLWAMIFLVLVGSIVVGLSKIGSLQRVKPLGFVNANRSLILTNFLLSALMLGLISNVLSLFGFSSGDIFPRPDNNQVRVIYGNFVGLEKCLHRNTEVDIQALLLERMMSGTAIKGYEIKVKSLDIDRTYNPLMIRRVLERHRCDVFVDGSYRVDCSEKPISLSLRYMGRNDDALISGKVDSLNVEDVLLGKATASLEEYIRDIPRKDVNPMKF